MFFCKISSPLFFVFCISIHTQPGVRTSRMEKPSLIQLKSVTNYNANKVNAIKMNITKLHVFIPDKNSYCNIH